PISEDQFLARPRGRRGCTCRTWGSRRGLERIEPARRELRNPEPRTPNLIDAGDELVEEPAERAPLAHVAAEVRALHVGGHVGAPLAERHDMIERAPIAQAIPAAADPAPARREDDGFGVV